MKIYKVTDRIPLYLGDDVKIECSPLSISQKSEVQGMMIQGQKNTDFELLGKASYLAVRMSLKAIHGVENIDGSPYSLSFENGLVTEECLNEILNIEVSESIVKTLVSFLNGIPAESKLPEGISYSAPSAKKKKS